MTGGNNATKPPGAWSAEQTVDYMIEKVFDDGDFYVIVPDNETNSVRRNFGLPFRMTYWTVWKLKARG